MDWLERRQQKERAGRLGRYHARTDAATSNARWGLYGYAAVDARKCAELVRPFSPTLGALWDQAAEAYQRRALPPLRLFDDDE
jgi:hypothetical protein